MSSSAVIEKVLLKAREAFQRNITKDVNFRRNQLKQLRKCLTENEKELCSAIKADLSKPILESKIVEIEFTVKEIDYHLDHLSSYMKPEYVTKKGIAFLLNPVKIQYEPFGVCLIFGAWNYPVQLILSPLAGAIAAGNCAIIKPSEVASNTEQLILKLIPKYLDTNCYHVLTGGAEDAQRILQERFDMIFFTGSPSIGRIVYQAAAKHLTPCVLELGGKCPCYVDDTVSSMEVTCRRILWAKLLNCGQTCIAPDYILCKPDVQDKIVATLKKVLKEFFCDDVKNSDSYSRVINERNFDRLVQVLNETNGEIVHGGKYERETKYIEPTIVTNVLPTDSLMKGELFGPIIPIVNIDSVDEAIEFIKRGEKPLAMYVFTNKKSVYQKFQYETSSGSYVVNDCVTQMLCDELPFGGVGQSGMGYYHGHWSFKAFSHKKSILIGDFNPLVEFLASARYPPYTQGKTNRVIPFARRSIVDKIDPWEILNFLVIFMLGVGTTIFGYYLSDKLK